VLVGRGNLAPPVFGIASFLVIAFRRWVYVLDQDTNARLIVWKHLKDDSVRLPRRHAPRNDGVAEGEAYVEKAYSQ
jgi:hypothetical protein